MPDEELTAKAVHEHDMRTDPEYRRKYNRARFASEVAIRMMRYQADHQLSRTIGRLLQMSRADVSRLEDGEYEPELEILQRLADVLGTDVSDEAQ